MYMSEKFDELFLRFCRLNDPDRTNDELELLALMLHKVGSGCGGAGHAY